MNMSAFSLACGANDQGIPTHLDRTLVADRPGPGRSIGCRNTRHPGTHSGRSIRLAHNRPGDYRCNSP